MTSPDKVPDQGGLFRLPRGIADSGGSPALVEFHGLSIAGSEYLVPRIGGWLNADERARADRFHRPIDRVRIVLGRGFVRALCAGHLHISPSEVILGQGPSGKPFLPGSSFEFSVSHSGDCVLIAWSAAGPVGADVEAVGRKTSRELIEIAGISFSAPEREILAAVPEQDWAVTFHRIWVRKEAVIKAEGVGLGGPLQDFSVVQLRSGQVCWEPEVIFPGTGRVWSLVDLEGPADCTAALAVPQGSRVFAGANALLTWQV